MDIYLRKQEISPERKAWVPPELESIRKQKPLGAQGDPTPQLRLSLRMFDCSAENMGVRGTRLTHFSATGDTIALAIRAPPRRLTAYSQGRAGFALPGPSLASVSSTLAGGAWPSVQARGWDPLRGRGRGKGSSRVTASGRRSKTYHLGLSKLQASPGHFPNGGRGVGSTDCLGTCHSPDTS